MPGLPNHPFTVYPAVDLLGGQVVRLRQGDPEAMTVYSSDPAAIAQRWMATGIRWLHVVNLDGAFGDPDSANRAALKSIIHEANRQQVQVQLGGGLRSLESVESAFDLGVARVILGTVAVENPSILVQLIERYGSEQISAGIDARDGKVRLHGWRKGTPIQAVELAQQLVIQGVRWLVFTDVRRDGVGTGINLPACLEMTRATGASVIAAGGVKGIDDLISARAAGLAGIIVGRALYEGLISIEDCV